MRTPTLRAALCGATTVALAAFAASALAEGPAGFKTASRACWTGRAGSNGRADHYRRRHAAERLPVRIDPGWHRCAGRAATVTVSTSSSTTRRRSSRSRSPIRATATEASQNDFDNAQVSRLTLNDETAGVLDGRLRDHERRGLPALLLELPRDEQEGFDRPILFTNEEGIDWVNRSGQSWPPPVGCSRLRSDRRSPAGRSGRRLRRPERPAEADLGHGSPQPREQRRDPRVSGRCLAVRRRRLRQQPCAIPGLRLHRPGPQGCLGRRGDLWAFVSNDPTVDDYYDFGVGDLTKSVSGRFVKVPKDVATGRKPNGDDLVAADKGYPPPPADDPPTWQRSIFPSGTAWMGRSGCSTSGGMRRTTRTT